MANFINVTLFNYVNRVKTPALVNLEQITHVFPQIITLRAVYDTKAPIDPVTRAHPILLEETKIELTMIVFAVGLGEDTDSIYVTDHYDVLQQILTAD